VFLIQLFCCANCNTLGWLRLRRHVSHVNKRLVPCSGEWQFLLPCHASPIVVSSPLVTALRWGLLWACFLLLLQSL
jgi:hypothetical protein